MRLTIYCPDVQSYQENPKIYLPPKPSCLNNPDHTPCWNTHWMRGIIIDHVHATRIPIFNAYCKICRETISFFPVMVLPYQREPLETHEQALVEHLQGTSISEIAARIGYCLRTVSRWIRLNLVQSPTMIDQAVRRILSLVGTGILPLASTVAREAAALLLAWLRRLAELIGYPHLDRLMGLLNLIGKGDWDLWGAPLGKVKSRVKRAPAPG